MSTFRKLAVCGGLGVILLSGSVSALAAEASPKEMFDAVWTSKKESDLDEATYVAVKRSPKDVVALVETAFSYTGSKAEPIIVEAAIRALRDNGTLDCDQWNDIELGGVAKSDETEKEYMIAELVEFLNPGNCGRIGSTGGMVLPGEAANANPVGGVGSPITLETVRTVTRPPSSGGGNTGGPPFDDDDDQPDTMTGAGT